MAFHVIPAIDIQAGKAVRLRQGRADAATVFSDSPVDVAKRFASGGASMLHVVDLDGAFTGRPVNVETILRIVSGTGVPVQVGGGVRNYDIASRYLGAGVSRVILGTSIVRNPEEVLRITKAYPGKVAAGIDAKEGFVAIRGWVEVTGVRAVDLARQMEERGISCFVYTDIARDGMMEGPNFTSIREFARGLSTPVIASGGVSAIGDLEELRKMESDGVVGVVIGRAMYDGTLSLADVLRMESR
ncbi:MAG TPA: 1-(5-phosphoribosyl)-5-[(5-phosphoribosylamino)methylideneamino]imidazole-4-carboxamide isomerase [Deltaproteobacteria bacterium]|nr:MAG: 1-(5-phosphoribosyl)-5-[(5-phosphoribosylamino)methylideneamino]imidazole-4-carboxamide isomerase [Deltaproteobacteria bacterium GWC2_65_14]HBO68631.1 1-(5-phosphoribosyl)-5-[(5-phosphoribosylamino)methylideneamino]imidazole-4-carboxamide isomerase [Deltaproteobacteria bacterium]